MVAMFSKLIHEYLKTLLRECYVLIWIQRTNAFFLLFTSLLLFHDDDRGWLLWRRIITTHIFVVFFLFIPRGQIVQQFFNDTKMGPGVCGGGKVEGMKGLWYRNELKVYWPGNVTKIAFGHTVKCPLNRPSYALETHERTRKPFRLVNFLMKTFVFSSVISFTFSFPSELLSFSVCISDGFGSLQPEIWKFN